MALLKTVFAFALTIICIFAFLPLALIAFLLCFTGLKKPMSWISYKLAQVWARGIVFITGCKMELSGIENIPKQNGICFVSNHVGIFDIILALAFTGCPFGFIAKKELAFIPFFNLWIPILGGLYLDRKNIRSALNTINRGIKKLQNGQSMLIFPEGTRSKGRGLMPFKSGAIKLATKSLATIVPIAITGSYDVFEKDYRVHPAPVSMVFCPPIVTSEMSADDRRHKLTDQVHSIIETALKSKGEK